MQSVVDALLFTSADSLGSIFLRGFIWLIVVLFFAAGIDSGRSYARIKSDAGWFFLFLFSAGIASYFIFGVAITF